MAMLVPHHRPETAKAPATARQDDYSPSRSDSDKIRSNRTRQWKLLKDMKGKRKNETALKKNCDDDVVSQASPHKILKTNEESTPSSTITVSDATTPTAARMANAPVTSSSRGASRKNRVYVFREFIQQTYGTYLLQQSAGTVVLDVAGGKGDLSWLLSNVDGLDSVVVDPRVTKSTHILRSVEYLREHPEKAKERAIPNRITYQPLAGLLPQLEQLERFGSPRHLRLLVDEDLVAAIRDYKENEVDTSRWEEYWKRATRRAIEAQPLGYKEDTSTYGGDSPTIQNPLEGLRTILSTKLVLGFHPDQATDPALDLAVLLGVPYCMVPCCVFPKEFPNRQLADGSRVRNYSELIQFLKGKYNPKIDALPFHFTETSKNLVLYSLPDYKASLLGE